ncbi:streptophobe family protein [Streptomyces sp. cg36]|uniref:streptophobe family protein n=1 Tax=Streptomyces sp. cg36 TaxID=3238798 RepID=UPI0034E23245
MSRGDRDAKRLSEEPATPYAKRAATRSGRVPWGDVLLASVASVSWAVVAMAGVAALGLHLLGADAAGALGPMTAAVVVLGAGGSVTPSGDVSAFGLTGAQARTAIDITPLGVSLAGALLLSFFFLRSLRAAGATLPGAELAARAGGVVALFAAVVAGLAWAGHDLITLDGGSLGLDTGKTPGGAGGIKVPGLGGLGDLGGLLPDRLGKLAEAKARVGFTVNTADSLAGALLWVLGVLLIALLASRRAPLPRRWEWAHRTVRPAASALVAVVLVAVLAGLAAAGYALLGDDHPRRILGAALLGAPNGVWLAIPLGLLVPWNGHATGALLKVLPDPLDKLLAVDRDRSVSLGRLAELDGRVWLLVVAGVLMMLYAGVLAAARTPVRELTPGAFAARCALALGAVTALALPLLVWLTGVSADASLSVLGFDAFGAGIELHGNGGLALVLGALWGAGAGGLGALLAYVMGAAGWRAAPLAAASALPLRSRVPAPAAPGAEEVYRRPGPYTPSPVYRPSHDETNPYLRLPEQPERPGRAGPTGRAGERGADGERGDQGRQGYQGPQGAPGTQGAPGVHGAPTVAGPMAPPPYRRGRPGPPPPPGEQPPPPPPGTPRGRR